MPNPGQIINLSDETKEALESQLSDLLQQAESDNAPYLDSLPTWWDWYDATPISSRRSDPWPEASNIIIPLIQTFSDAVVARMWGAMHTAQRTWSYKTENEQLSNLVTTIDEFINHESRSTFDVLVPTHDWAFENAVVGSSVLGVFWNNKMAYRFNGTKKPQMVTISRGPEFVHIPREDIMWERDRTIQQSSFVARQCHYSWSDMVNMTQTYGWAREDVEECRGQSGIEGPSGRALDRKRETSDATPGTGAGQEYHGVWEVWIDWPLAQLMTTKAGNVTPPDMAELGDQAVPIVIDYHRKAQKILKVRAHPYYFWRWPFLDMYFQKLPGRGSSKGLAKMLEHMQRAATTMVNQSIDRRTLENSLPFVTNSPSLRNYRFQPNSPVYTDDIQDLRQGIMPLNLVSQPVGDISLMNFITSVSERVTGISDVNLGRETRLGGHPAPATNTLVQLEEGAKIMGTRLQLARQQLGTAAEWVLSMYQQFGMEDSDRLAQKLGPEDADRLRQVFVGGDDISFDAYAISNTINPDTERSAAIALTQVSANYYGFVLRMLSLVENPQLKKQQPMVVDAAMKAIASYTETYKRVLTASDVDEVDKFIIQMREAKGQDEQAIGEFGDFANNLLQQQLRAGASAPPGIPGAPPGGPGNVQQPGMGANGDGAGVTVPVVR